MTLPGSGPLSMTTAGLCVLILLGAAAFHVCWAAGGRVGFDAALPRHPGNGEHVFTPGAGGALAVGLLLVLAAALVALLGAQIAARPMPTDALAPAAAPAPLLLRAAVGAMALVFLVRALGAFRFAGWFKTVRDTRFARYDTWLYCPLCLLLGLGLSQLVVAGS